MKRLKIFFTEFMNLCLSLLPIFYLTILCCTGTRENYFYLYIYSPLLNSRLPFKIIIRVITCLNDYEIAGRFLQIAYLEP
jgi:hypothetical protein